MSGHNPAQRELAKVGTTATAVRVAALILVLVALWIARPFLLPLAFALILSVAIWPLYHRASRRATHAAARFFVPLAFTLVIGAVLIFPFAVFASEAVRDSNHLAKWLMQATHSGIPRPEWVRAVPGAGGWLAAWWDRNLADPHGASALLGPNGSQSLPAWLRTVAGSLLSWVLFIFITLLALFICLRSGAYGAAALSRTARRLFGPAGGRFIRRVAEAIRGTLNGIVLVSFGEGLLIGGGYTLSGLPHPISFTIVAMGLALVSFGAWAAFALAALFLVIQGHAIAGLVLFGYSAAVMLVGDNLVQPAVVGTSIRLPFLWTFVGIFGGMYSFGLVGLFVGPAIMAALFLLWTESDEIAVRADRAR